VDRSEVSALFYPAKQTVTGTGISDAQAGVANTELLDLDTDPYSEYVSDLNSGVNITV
jgi:hypothetical protein